MPFLESKVAAEGLLSVTCDVIKSLGEEVIDSARSFSLI